MLWFLPKYFGSPPDSCVLVYLNLTTYRPTCFDSPPFSCVLELRDPRTADPRCFDSPPFSCVFESANHLLPWATRFVSPPFSRRLVSDRHSRRLDRTFDSSHLCINLTFVHTLQQTSRQNARFDSPPFSCVLEYAFISLEYFRGFDSPPFSCVLESEASFCVV